MKREQKTSGLRRILSHPAVYDAYDALVGTRGVRRAFVREYVQAFLGAHVLDLGCGSGKLLRYLPGVAYTGVDISSAYIRTAQRRYSNRGTFILGSAIDADLGPDHSFDIVVAFGLLHHVNDVTAREVVSRAKRALKRGGRFVTLDPCFETNQNRFAQFLHKKDRGRHVRYVDGYLKLAHMAFEAVSHQVLHNIHPVVPSTTLIMTCLSAPSGPLSVRGRERDLDRGHQPLQERASFNE